MTTFIYHSIEKENNERNHNFIDINNIFRLRFTCVRCNIQIQKDFTADGRTVYYYVDKDNYLLFITSCNEYLMREVMK